MSRPLPAVARRRRTRELGLGMAAVLLVVGAYVLASLADEPDLPTDLWFVLGIVVALLAVAHVAVRRLAPCADPTLLPLVVMLNGLGFVVIARLDRELAEVQAVWTAVGVGAFVLTLGLVRSVRVLARYRYTFLALGVLALLLPLAPGVGREINGGRLWVRLGPLNFQPGEAAKILLVIFFAAYLVEKRELLASGTRQVGRLLVPDPKHLGPLLLAWGVSIIVMVMEKDLGSSLLFFAVFAAMLYMATERAAYILTGFVLFVGGATAGYRLFDHVRSRVTTWLDPWPRAQGSSYQLVQSLFAFGTGGFAGTGFGLGNPQNIPNAATDFIFAAIGEELGFVGSCAVLITYMLLVGTGFRIAIRADRPFAKLFAAGLTAMIGVQTFVIVGGVTRVIPLTGITLPFMSYGGSSLVANWVLIALLVRVSDETDRAPASARALQSAVVV